MKEKSMSERQASFLTEPVNKDLPKAVIEKAKLSILDLFGAHFAGHHIEASQPKRQIRWL